MGPSSDRRNGEQRIAVLDLLRGTYIILALWQHYSGYLTLKDLPVDTPMYWLHRLLTPSGDQLFLALAAFNLARRPRGEFAAVYTQKLRFFGTLFCFFVFESFLVAESLGEALSWGPLLTWMVLLSFVATLYRFGGWGAVVFAFVAHLSVWALPMGEWNEQLELAVRTRLALPYFIYESKLDLFVGSACLGFLAGYAFHHARGDRSRLLGALVAAGVTLTLPFFFLREWPELNPGQVWGSEYEMARDPLGMLNIWGTILGVIALGLLLERVGLVRPLPLVTWCGRHSLLIFALHRVIFVRFLLPLTQHTLELRGLALENTLPVIAAFSAATLLIVYVVRRSGLLRVLDRA